MFWDLVIWYETSILIFISAHRERNFSLYVEVLEILTPLVFDPIKQEFGNMKIWRYEDMEI